ncbi:MAG: glycosyltransferase [Rikenellaceae bacterium]
MKLLSIIIPVYNGIKYISRCLDSIYATDISLNIFEVICVDDCSTDNSVDLIKEYQSKYENLYLICHDVNKRQGGAKNSGVDIARGKFIAFVDQDDTIDRCHFEKLMFSDYLNINDLDVIVFKFCLESSDSIFTENGLTIETPFVETGIQFCEKYLNPAFSFAPWTNWYRRSYWECNKFKYAENVLWEDADLIAKVLFCAKTIQFVPITMYNWHYNVASISHTINHKILADRVFYIYRKYLVAVELKASSLAFFNILIKDINHNISCVRKIWRLSFKDRILFYEGLKKYNIPSFDNIVDDKFSVFILNHRKLVLSVLIFIAPLLELAKVIKQSMK